MSKVRNSRQRARDLLIRGSNADRLRCSYCGRAISRKVPPGSPPVLMGTELTYPFTVDHVIPKASGGPNSVENLIPACEPCNVDRGNMPILAFVLKLGSRSIMSTHEALALEKRGVASREAAQCRRY